MNELRPHSNESVLENRTIKKDLKEVKVTTYIDKVYLPFW